MQIITIMRKELAMDNKEPYNDLQAMCDDFIDELYEICNECFFYYGSEDEGSSQAARKENE